MKNPGKEKQFRCIDFPPCEKSFNQIENLRAHLRLHSLNHNAVLKCPEVGCTSVLSSLKHLKRHIKEVHSKEPRFKCPFCDEKFLRKCWLRNHTESCHDFHELQCTHGISLIIAIICFSYLSLGVLLNRSMQLPAHF